jgi:hypothetical protein
MNHQRTGVPILARFPDVHDDTKRNTGAIPRGRGLLESSGRWISQAMSVKLLAGMTLFLLVGAVLPFCIGRNADSKDSTAAIPLSSGDAVSTGQPAQTQTPVEAIPTTSQQVAGGVARRPAVLVSATAEQLPPPVAIPVVPGVKQQPPAIPTVAESLLATPPAGDVKHEPAAASPPMMASEWSPPPGADLQPEGTARPDGRSTEYNADTRVGQQPQR